MKAVHTLDLRVIMVPSFVQLLMLFIWLEESLTISPRQLIGYLYRQCLIEILLLGIQPVILAAHTKHLGQEPTPRISAAILLHLESPLHMCGGANCFVGGWNGNREGLFRYWTYGLKRSGYKILPYWCSAGTIIIDAASGILSGKKILVGRRASELPSSIF